MKTNSAVFKLLLELRSLVTAEVMPNLYFFQCFQIYIGMLQYDK